MLIGFLGTSTLLPSWTLPSDSLFVMALVNPPAWPDVSQSIHNTRHFSWTAGFPYASRLDSHGGPPRLHDISLSTGLQGLRLDDTNAFSALNTTSAECTTHETAPSGSQAHIDLSKGPTYKSPYCDNRNSRRPFHKWMRSLHRRISHRSDEEAIWPPDAGWQYLESDQTYQQSLRHKLSRRLSSSGSSLGLIAAVQSASISLASGSAASRSRRRQDRSRCRSRAERSSRASLSVPRFSEDSVPMEKGKIDIAAMHRSMRRRQILEELISTEEGYIGDVRFLIHVRWCFVPCRYITDDSRPTSTCLPLFLLYLNDYARPPTTTWTASFSCTKKC